MEDTTQALAKVSGETSLAVFQDAFDYKENKAHILVSRPDVVKIQSQTKSFEFPGGVFIQKFNGVIYSDAVTSKFWHVSMDQGGSGAPPDCFSMNCVTPSARVESPVAETCALCPKSKFGSDDKGSGKACRQERHVLILLEDGESTIDLRLPPTSIKVLDIYFADLLRRKIPFPVAFTEFSLVGDKSKNGTPYAKLSVRGLGLIDEELIPTIKELQKKSAELLAQITGGVADEVKSDVPF